MRKNANASPRRSASTEDGSLFAWPRFGLEYTVEPYDDAPDLYTFYPEGASDEEIITQWISASEESVVDITAVR
ncbi:DUF7511 domain-containing protein [Halomarina litorea]|uniref:DUF7511 domain-containing protein n=1 Tax=Halomarina litorea TaxID=2961595 RepID=UPI0020C2D708|nr:hypothetical protein [Halomarina sp. BCD28]